MTKYNLIICGGTFDLLHKGHKTFLKRILNISERVVLGLTSNLYVKLFKNGNEVEEFGVRKKELELFLDSIGAKNRVKMVEISDIYGPLLNSSISPQAIVVTSQTEKTATVINRDRKARGLPELEIIIFSISLAEDGKIISSTRIRKGEIDRNGKLYLNPKWRNKKLILPNNLRSVLQSPLGEVLKEIPEGLDSSKAITIGDITAQKFNKDKINQFLSIIDFLVQRKIKFNSLPQLGFSKSQKFILVNNPPGTINSELFEVFTEIFKKERDHMKVVLIKGEEDLAALAVLLVAPLGYTIFYGQPSRGLVRVVVNEENKEKVYNLLEKFTLI